MGRRGAKHKPISLPIRTPFVSAPLPKGMKPRTLRAFLFVLTMGNQALSATGWGLLSEEGCRMRGGFAGVKWGMEVEKSFHQSETA